MGFFTKLERLSEKYIEGFFKTRFAGHIQPAEIAKILLREMRDSKEVSVSKVYVPNKYIVFLGEQDWKTVDSVRTSLSLELQDYLKKKAREKGYELVGDVSVAFVPDDKLSLGTITVESSFSEAVDAVKPVQEDLDSHTIIAERNGFFKEEKSQLSDDTLTRLNKPSPDFNRELVIKIGTKEGNRFPLGKHGVIIGRRKTNEIYIDDANASRSHASVDYSDGDYFIADLGSTNGTFVNGVRVSRVRLEPGDLIKIGTTVLEFKVV